MVSSSKQLRRSRVASIAKVRRVWTAFGSLGPGTEQLLVLLATSGAFRYAKAHDPHGKAPADA